MTPLTPAEIGARLHAWLADDPVSGLDLDAPTADFCHRALRLLGDPAVLARKLELELSRPSGQRWRPLGRLLVVVSENDVLGTAFALIAAALTGNRVRLKARETAPLALGLRAALNIDAADWQILDWASAEQDDAAVLAEVDGVLLAGPGALIAHFRAATPPEVRLIEFGPRTSLAVIGAATTEADLPALADALWADATLFRQRVCSAPQVVLVDAAAPTKALFAALAARLNAQPPLPAADRLAAQGPAREARLQARLDASRRAAWSETTGWALTCQSGDLPTWLAEPRPPGLHLLIGDLDARLAEARARLGRGLQTAGVFGLPPAQTHALADRGFTRVCPIGEMHARSPLEPHDGFFELPALVDFLSEEVAVAAGPSRVFVTGGTGFIGRAVVEALRARGDQVTALVRPAARGRLPANVRAVVGELTAPDTYAAALPGHDAVVHLAADYRLGPVDRAAMFATNVVGTRAVLDAALRAGVGRIVHVSSTAAYGDTGGGEGDESTRHDGVFRSFYEQTKHIAHGLVAARMAFGLPILIVAPGGVFGPGDRSALAVTLRDAMAGRLPFAPDTRSRFNLCALPRVVDGLLRALDHSPLGESWILTGANVSMPELIDAACRHVGRKPPPRVPVRLLAPLARALDPIARLTGAALPLSAEAIRILDGSTYTCRADKARRRLGWQPGDFQEDFARYLDTLRPAR